MAVTVTDIVFDSYDAGKTSLETAAATTLSAFLTTLIQLKYVNLAKNYYKLYKKQRDFYYTNFQPGGEQPFANEQFSIPPYVPDYLGVLNVGYFPPGVLYLFRPELANRVASMPQTWARHAFMYNSFQEVTASPAVDVATLTDDWFSYQFRYEEHKRDVFNERRWANRMDSLSYGIKEGASVERGLATSFQVFDEASGQLVSSINTIGNGLATYVSQRNTLKSILDNPNTHVKYQTSNFTNVFNPQQDRIFSSGFQ